MNRLHRLDEPKLVFGLKQQMEDPRDGLGLFGAFELNQVASIRAAYVGTKDGIRRMQAWVQKLQRPIANPKPTRDRPMFPGFEAVFGVKWNPKPLLALDIDDKVLDKQLNLDDLHQRIFGTVSLYERRILDAIGAEDERPDIWFVIVPDKVYERCRPQSSVPFEQREAPAVKLKRKEAKEIARDGLLPGIMPEVELAAKPYAYVPDFRNQLKGRLLSAKVLTQVIRESTIACQDFLTPWGKPIRNLTNLAADIAWNLSTAIMYKAGAKPWKLAGVRPGVCYLGLVFKQDLTSADPRSACSAAQMFLDSGDGLVFRGSNGLWYSHQKGQYHLNKAAAAELVSKAVAAYAARNSNQPPKELFLHGRIRFSEEEWAGFREGAGPKTSVVGVRINRGSDLRLFRQEDSMPLMRGLAFISNERQGILWTNGYVPRLGTSTAREVPRPILVEISCGEAPIETVLQDVMGLTKLNYNCCRFTDGLPVTLRFAEAVGEILTSGPMVSDAPMPFRHYI